MIAKHTDEFEYTPTSADSLAMDIKFDRHLVTFKQREAASRAIIRYNQHKSDEGEWDSTKGTLHPTFLRLNDPGVTSTDERAFILRRTWEDLCDVVSLVFLCGEVNSL